MTIQQKNEAIAKALGWKITFNGFYYEWKKPNNEKLATFKELKFHSDDNWQGEALDYFQAYDRYPNQIVQFFILVQSCSLTIMQANDGRSELNWFSGHAKIYTRRESIFEALYKFSEYDNGRKKC